LLNFDSLDSISNKLLVQLPVAWKAGLSYWPFVHMITFGVIPLQHQSLFANVASIYWMSLLSYYAHINEENTKAVGAVTVAAPQTQTAVIITPSTAPTPTLTAVSTPSAAAEVVKTAATTTAKNTTQHQHHQQQQQ
jgi:hypothetical protein